MRYRQSHKGTTLMETLIAAAVFVAFSVALYELYANVAKLSSRIRIKTIATQVASEQMEFIRNLQYVSVGTTSGIPSGVVSPTETVVRNGVTFLVTTTIRNIDHPADGTLGGSPNDLSPADNKLVAIEVSCTSCSEPITVEYTSAVAPKSLETENGNGALVIRAIDANGQPVPSATVSIVNNTLSPTVNITDVTDTSGVLTLVDAPPSVEGYAITVSKNGFSTERTYLTGDGANPNPTKPHLTVSENTVTQSTFSIDRFATIDLRMQSPLCADITGISGTLTGGKVIGTSPNVIKHILPFSVSSNPLSLTTIEWDTYSLGINSALYDIAGITPIFPLSITPGQSQQVSVTLKPAMNNRLVVAVIDGSGLPVAGASVSITGPSGSFSGETSVGSVTQTDWSGGNGQELYEDTTKFYQSSGVVTGTSGVVTLQESSGTYLSDGSLESSTINFGAATTFEQLSRLPTNQPSGVGAQPIAFQLATNLDNATWNFIGPDGTDQTFYTNAINDIADIHNGDQFLRYKVFLSTADTSKTPTLSDVAITYASGCLPQGQIDFGGLSNGTYEVTVSKSGYTTTVKDVTINTDAYESVIITP